MRTNLGVRAVVIHERLLNLHPLLRIPGRDGGIELVQLVERQVGVELVGLLLEALERFEVLQPRHLGGVGGRRQRRDVLRLMAPSEEGRHRAALSRLFRTTEAPLLSRGAWDKGAMRFAIGGPRMPGRVEGKKGIARPGGIWGVRGTVDSAEN